MIPLDQVEFEKHDHPHARRRFNLSPQVFDALLLLIPAMLVTAKAQLSFKYGMYQGGELPTTTYDGSMSMFSCAREGMRPSESTFVS